MRDERFLEKDEIENLLTAEGNCRGGYVLHNSRQGINYSYVTEGNQLVLGVPGTGKTRRQLIPTLMSLIRANESFCVFDPKGEIYDATAHLISDSTKTYCIDFRNPTRSSIKVNPLATPYKYFVSGDLEEQQIGTEMIENFVAALYSDKTTADAFWPLSARNLTAGIIFSLFLLAPSPEYVNLTAVYSILSIIEERFDCKTIGTSLVELLPPDSVAAMLIRAYTGCSAHETRAGILVTAMEGLLPYVRSDAIKVMLSKDDLHIKDIDGSIPISVYIILPDENKLYDPIAGTLVDQLFQHFIRIAHSKYQGRLPVRLNFLLDELGQIGNAIPGLSKYMAAARSRNIRISLVLQALSQLDEIYGSSNAATIRAASDIVCAFRTNNIDTLNQLSTLCGQRNRLCADGTERSEPLISPAQLSQMVTGQALVMISGKKFVTQLSDYTETGDYSPTGNRRRLPCKKGRSQSKPKIFDLMGFLKRRKVEEIKSQAKDKDEFDYLMKKAVVQENVDSEIDKMIAEIDAEIARCDKEMRDAMDKLPDVPLSTDSGSGENG